MIVLRGTLWVFLVLLAGCGQRGGLYLPDKKTAKVEAPAQPESKDESKKKDE